ncbi:hypothetical protein ABPG74_002492 [Tetrahymena malaccensis]
MQDGSRFLQKSMSVINSSNYIYMMVIYVGKSQTKVNVQLDTGSYALWFASEQCQDCSNNYPNRYNCLDTDGCILSQEDDTLKFGDKTIVQGKIGKVTVKLGDGTTILNQPFLYVTQGQGIIAGKEDGIFGLGTFDIYNKQNKYQNWVNILYNNQIISQNQFSFYLDSTQVNSQSSKSVIMLGSLDKKYLQENAEINTFPVTQKVQWTIASTEVSYGNSVISSSNIDVLIDSGSSSMSLPKNMVDSIKNVLINEYSFKQEDSKLQGTCEKRPPSFTFNFKDINGQIVKYTLEPEYYLTYFPNENIVAFSFGKHENDEQENDEYEDQIILGDVFMRKYVSTFSYSPYLTIQLAQSITQPDNIPFKDSDNEIPFPLWAKIIIPIVVCLIIAGIAYYFYKRKQNQKLQNAQLAESLKQSLQQSDNQEPQQNIN